MTAESTSAVAEALGRFLGERLGRSVAVTGMKRYSVGFSWETYGFALRDGDEEQRLILRLAPMAGILPSYRAAPEAALLRSVEPLGLPIPRVLWHSDDPAHLGASFAICTLCPGEAPLILRKPSGSGAAELYALACQFVDCLGKLHGLDWQNSDYAAFAKPVTLDNAARSEVDYWAGVIENASTRAEPIMEWVRRWLVANAPAAPRIGIVHGDYRLGNFLAENGRITGILDWELAHVGDPHDDLGWALVVDFNGMSDRLFGVMERSEVFDRYEAVTGVRVDPASIRYYDVLSRFKLCAIFHSALGVFAKGRSNDLRAALLGSQRARTAAQLTALTEAL